MNEFKSLVFLAFLTTALFFDRINVLWFGILAAQLHEAGHIFVYLLLYKKIPKLKVGWWGIAMRYPEMVDPSGELFLLAAGPVMNFLVAIVIYAALLHRASFGGWIFACENLAIGLFNLLPVGYLDGGRLLKLCFKETHQKVSCCLSFILIGGIAIFAATSCKTPFVAAMTGLLAVTMFYKLIRQD